MRKRICETGAISKEKISISNDVITFPTTTETFTARQEAGARRKLNDFEKELMKRSVEVMNDCYEGGRAGKRIPFLESEEDARQILSDMGKADRWEQPFMRRYIRFMLFWTRTAYEQGQMKREI